MADFRKCILALTVLVLFAGLASAQVNGGTGGSTNLSCVANAAVPPQLRSEGYTELTGDITLNCNGGVLPAGGTQITTANITVYLNGTVTSRLISSSGGASEALLLIDEPGSGLGGYGPQVPLTVCTTAMQAANSCILNLGTVTTDLCGGTVCPAPVLPGSVGAPLAGPTAVGVGYNAFQGTVSGSSVTFFGVPVLAPGTTGTRIYRITNVRVNANGITGGGPIPANVVAAIAISGATSLPVTNPQLTTGFIAPSLSGSIRNFAGGAFSDAVPGLTQPLQCTVPGGVGNGKLFGQGNVRFTELFGTAFKTRVAPSTVNPNGSGGTGQSGTAVQNIPGFIYSSESGFIPGVALAGATYNAGLADFGTRLKATFNNIPSGISVYVSTTNTFSGVVATPATSLAVMVSSENAQENTSSSGSNTPSVTATGTTTNSGQGKPALAVAVPYYQLPIVNGTATAVWEVVNSYPNLNENFEFLVWLSYTASPATNTPAAGTMTASVNYAPSPSGGLFTAAQGGTASSSLPIPRFGDTGTAANFAQVTVCTTALLFPFITNTNGFDTGVAIANTSVDPFGTSAQAGTCTLSWYGNATTTSNPPSSTLGASGVGSTTPIAAGTVVTALASTTVPGFQGYMIASCQFQFAHGFAFISDLGARNLAMGYLALIMNSPGVGFRPTGIAEVLGQ